MTSADSSMYQQVSFVDIPIATSVQQILSFDDESFIYCSYRTLLKREPDDVGKSYYLSRLRGGENKVQILSELSASAEGRRIEADISGLQAAIKRLKIARLFGIGRPPAVKQQLLSQGPQNNQPSNQPAITSAPQTKSAVCISRIPVTQDTRAETSNENLAPREDRTVWVDLTTSLEWTQGTVGIIRAELEIATGLNRVGSNVRFSMQIENGFVEVEKEQLKWLLDSENVADSYMTFFGRHKSTSDTDSKSQDQKPNVVTVHAPQTTAFQHPFRPHDIIVSAGWMDSKKEVFFAKLKQELASVYVCYLVYDIILLLKDTAHFYDESGRDRFKRYIKWISYNCDFVLFGGQTAQNDTRQLQLSMGWPTPPGAAVKFGTDIMKSVDQRLESEILESMGIIGPFVMTVGSIEPRKNHDTLYKAYLMALRDHSANLPQLVICGRPMWRVDDLIDTIDRDPRLSGKIIRISPTDTQLATLYKRCLFTLLPSMYEGWSLTLPESLGQGKFCLCADTPPLREIGKDLIDYAPIFDVRSWADKIALYSSDKSLLAAYEKRIVNEWPETRWIDTASMIFTEVTNFADHNIAIGPRPESHSNLSVWEKPTIWMDMTLTYLQWGGGVTGIIRSELNYARYLKKIEPSTRFFAYQDNYFFEILPDYLTWLFNDSDLASAYKMFQNYWSQHESEKTGHRNPFQLTGGPSATHPAFLSGFPGNSIVLFVGIDSDGTGTLYRSKHVGKLVSNDKLILTSQLIYDFTPILYPQFHTKETCVGYVPFIKNVSETFDHLLFGGRTALRDGLLIQKKNNWKSPPSDYIEFGSNFEKPAALPADQQEARDEQILQHLGVSTNFIMTVGTIEPRKNHEMLYKAYVTLLNSSGEKDLPQMLFIGKKGWKSNDFLANFDADMRIKNKIILLSPTDEELDTLYRHCLFTVLPSFYEGWSLTLPESLSYGKFCITSDVDPLRETGRDLVEYIDPLDTYAWADRIRYYSANRDVLSIKEEYIKSNWRPKSWVESTEMLMDALYAAHKARYFPSGTPKIVPEKSLSS